MVRDGPAGTQLPKFLTNASNYNSSILLHEQIVRWDNFPPGNPQGWNGFSLLIDDVERFAGDMLNFSLAALDASVPHFFRLAVSGKDPIINKRFTKIGKMSFFSFLLVPTRRYKRGLY